MGEYSFLFDESLCIGCESCRISCKAWNSLSPESSSAVLLSGNSASTWIRNSYGASSVNQTRCFHCHDAECVKACPEDAIVDMNGFTVINHDKCIGCGACEKACPYQAVFVNRTVSTIKVNKAYKCHGCAVNTDSTPHCALNCPSGALQYGYRKKLLAQAEARVASLRSTFPEVRLNGVKEFGGLSVLTIRISPEENKRSSSRADEDLKFLYKSIGMFVPGFTPVKRAAYRFLSFLKG